MVKLNPAYRCSNCSTSLYDVEEASKLLSVHRQTVIRWVRAGTLETHNLRGFYFTEEQIKNSIR